MEQKIRIGSVSYLNTKPLIYGFEKGYMADQVELIIDYPANIAQKLLSNELDVGLIPIAVIPQLSEYHIISDYCIACNGPVASVCLFSEVPIHAIETIILDYQSRTSVALLKLLLRDYWQISPRLVVGGPGYEQQIAGTTAGLVIGDRAFSQRLGSTYMYDLGEAWKSMTGLPFVFAAWVSNKKLNDDFITGFNNAIAIGSKHLEEIVAENICPHFDLMKYYTEYIQFKIYFKIENVIEEFLGRVEAEINI